MMFNIVRSFSFLLTSVMLSGCVNVDSKSEYASGYGADGLEPDVCQSEALEQGVRVNHAQANDRGLNPDNISLLNWNLYKGNGENWQTDLSAFAQDHDVMTIQEAYLDEELSGLLKLNNFNWVMKTAFHLNGTPTGVMTVASSDAVASCGFKNDEPVIRVPKATLVSYYSIAGHNKKLLVANIHGINFTLGMTAYREQLEQLFDTIRYHDGPMIVAGDFNTWSDERMVEVMQLVERLSMSSLEYKVNNKTHVFGNAIDHVFYRQLQPLSKKVWQVTTSDHNPISVTFRLAPESGLIVAR